MSCPVCRGYVGVECPACGHRCELPEEPAKYYALNIVTRKDVEVTGSAWHALPKDEDDAERQGKRYCRQDEGYVPLPDRRPPARIY